jgi:short-subunit dehydrogenase
VTGGGSGIGRATVDVDVTDEASIAKAMREAVLAFGCVDLVVNNAGLSISRPLLETTAADWDSQHDVMARGSFLVPREAARVMKVQGMGGDIIYICSKNAVFAGPDNVAYGAAKSDQAYQVRLLAAELGTFYAQRTLLKREVLSEHIAAAVVALVAGDLSLTTGLHIPVDGGVAAAFLR